MFWAYFLLLVIASILLIKATGLLLSSLRGLSLAVGIDKFGLTAFALALATSLPELVVGVAAAVRGDPELSLGNVVGSNIANISLVLGGAALVAGTIRASDRFLKEEVFHTFLAGALPFILLMDRALTRFDGLLLLWVYGFYNMTVLRSRSKAMVEQQVKMEGGWWHRMWYRIGDKKVERWLGKMILGVALLVFSADMVVRSAHQMALIIHFPILLVGMLVVAVGTSLPELSFEIAAVRKRESQMALGNILGSVVANSTLILGLTAIISPIRLTNGLESYLLATVSFIVIFFFFWLFVRSKHVLERWEGLFLVALYWAFVLGQFWELVVKPY